MSRGSDSGVGSGSSSEGSGSGLGSGVGSGAGSGVGSAAPFVDAGASGSCSSAGSGVGFAAPSVDAGAFGSCSSAGSGVGFAAPSVDAGASGSCSSAGSGVGSSGRTAGVCSAPAPLSSVGNGSGVFSPGGSSSPDTGAVVGVPVLFCSADTSAAAETGTAASSARAMTSTRQIVFLKLNIIISFLSYGVYLQIVCCFCFATKSRYRIGMSDKLCNIAAHKKKPSEMDGLLKGLEDCYSAATVFLDPSE